MITGRTLVSALLFVAGVALAASSLSTASSQTPTATPTPSPTTAPTPSPTASPLYPQSQITVRFVNSDGQSVTINTTLTNVQADGVECVIQIGVPRLISGTTFAWPLPPEPGQPAECSKAPPTTLRVAFGPLSVQAVWTGVDVTVDLLVPGAATASATPNVGGLPGTGGSPRSGGNLAIGLVALGALIGVAGSVAGVGMLLRRSAIRRR